MTARAGACPPASFPRKLAHMKPLLILGLAALAGCASTGPAPLATVENVRYNAIGHDPFWIVAVGDDKVVLTLGPAGGRADGELESFAYPRPLPREADGVRRWQSGEGTQVITIEARKAACQAGGRSYPDKVKVSLSGRVLQGCGGREQGARG
jgi:uncharacterized membrane protein